MNWKLLAFVSKSESRIKILLSLEKAGTPTQIASRLKMHKSQVGLTLKQFNEKGLVICVNPQDRKGKIYRLTKDGESILKYLKK